MPNKYSYSCKFIAKTGNGEELIDILLAAAKLLESNEDCLFYRGGVYKYLNRVIRLRGYNPFPPIITVSFLSETYQLKAWPA